VSLPSSFEVEVKQVRLDTHDTATLFLDAGRRVPYRAGQYVGIDPHQFPELKAFIVWLEAQKGKREPQRKYSLASAPQEDLLAITIKEEEYVPGQSKYPPLLSNLLVRGLSVGARFSVFGCSGPYVLNDDFEGLVVHVVAGTGAVPNFSILKDSLLRGLKARHLWIASNKTREDILYHSELLALEQRFPQALQIMNTLTRDPSAGDAFRKGRVGAALLDELIPKAERESCLVFACGPAVHPWDRKAALESGTDVTPRFMETVLGDLHGLGIVDKRIRRETYG
jgi:3-ketosteroid 9alpha-monooxygenase subunit B